MSIESGSIETPQAFAILFNTDGSDLMAGLRAFSKLLELITYTERCVALIPGGDADDYAACFPPIYKAFAGLQFEGQWYLHDDQVRKQDIALLKLAAKALDDVLPEQELAEAELGNLRTEFAEIIDGIKSAQITPQLEAVLLREASRMMEALNSYNVTGATGIKEAAASAYGRIVVDREIIVPQRESPWVTKFYVAIARASDIASVALYANALGWEAAKIIERFAPPF